MRDINDERLHKLLSEFYQAEPEKIPLFHSLNESDSCETIPAHTFKNRNKLVAAASMIFIFVLSISLFFYFGNKKLIPISVYRCCIFIISHR